MYMVSKQITVGVGIPMIIVGALIALLWAPAELELGETIEFVGSLIGILGVIFLIAGLFYTKEPVLQ
jgi:flagellar biosynthesis protein FliQ